MEDLSFIFAWQVQPLEDLSLILPGRCSIWTQLMGPKKIFHTLTIHRPTFGALALSQPSYPFCLIPPDTRFVFPRCGFWIVLCSVSSNCSTVGCAKTLLAYGVIRPFNFYRVYYIDVNCVPISLAITIQYFLRPLFGVYPMFSGPHFRQSFNHVSSVFAEIGNKVI